MSKQARPDPSRHDVEALCWLVENMGERLARIEAMLESSRPLTGGLDRNDILRMPITSMGLHVTMERRLVGIGITTVGELVAKDRREMIDNGTTGDTLRSLERRLEERGLYFGFRPGASTPPPPRPLSHDDLLSQAKVDLSPRVYNCLARRGIHTVGDVLKFTNDQLLAFKHFGVSELRELRNRLDEAGLSLSENAADR